MDFIQLLVYIKQTVYIRLNKLSYGLKIQIYIIMYFSDDHEQTKGVLKKVLYKKLRLELVETNFVSFCKYV